MSRLKAAVFGAGVFGAYHARKYAEDSRVALQGVYDPDAARAKALAQALEVRAFASAAALIEAADIVTVASPPTAHFAQAGEALRAGKHVLVEKPLAVDPREGAALVALARERRLTLAVGHQERIVLEAIGLTGVEERPLQIAASRAGPWTGRSADVSVSLDLMIHDIDMACALTHGSLAALTHLQASGRRAHGAAHDELHARFGFGGGGDVRLHASRVAPARARTMRLDYARGAVEIDFVAKRFENSAGLSLNADFMQHPDAQDSLGANVRRFIDAVLGAAAAPAVSGADALAALELAHAIDAAADAAPAA